MQNEAQEYIQDLFLFQDKEVRMLEFGVWQKYIESTEPLDTAMKVDFFRGKRDEILANQDKDLFTTWLILFDGINAAYLEKLGLFRDMYTKGQFQGWYWVTYKKYWYIEERLKGCDNEYKYKGIATALKDYISGADDATLVRLICTKDEFESSARWIGIKADAMRFKKHFGISPKRMRKTLGVDLSPNNQRKEIYKDSERYLDGLSLILTRYN